MGIPFWDSKVTSGFMAPFYLDSGGTNKGIDYGPDADNPIIDAIALEGGTVIQAGAGSDGWGTSVKIRTADGRTFNFGHLNTVNVRVGDTVSRGTLLGSVDFNQPTNGTSTGPHLSVDVWDSGGDYFDPSQFLGDDMVEPIGGIPGIEGGQSARSDTGTVIANQLPSSVPPELTLLGPTEGGMLYKDDIDGDLFVVSPTGVISPYRATTSSTPRDAEARALDQAQAAGIQSGIRVDTATIAKTYAEIPLIGQNTELTAVEAAIKRRQLNGDLIPLADGRFLIPGTTTVIDTRQPGQFKPIEGMPGYAYDPVSGEVIDDNGNQIARGELDQRKHEFALEFPEKVRQHNELLAEDRRQFDTTHGENVRQFDLELDEDRAQFGGRLGFDLASLGENARATDIDAWIKQQGLGLEASDMIRQILANPSDYVARAFFQRGEQSPGGVVTQADLVNMVKGILGDSLGGPKFREASIPTRESLYQANRTPTVGGSGAGTGTGPQTGFAQGAAGAGGIRTVGSVPGVINPWDGQQDEFGNWRPEYAQKPGESYADWYDRVTLQPMLAAAQAGGYNPGKVGAQAGTPQAMLDVINRSMDPTGRVINGSTQYAVPSGGTSTAPATATTQPVSGFSYNPQGFADLAAQTNQNNGTTNYSTGFAQSAPIVNPTSGFSNSEFIGPAPLGSTGYDDVNTGSQNFGGQQEWWDNGTAMQFAAQGGTFQSPQSLVVGDTQRRGVPNPELVQLHDPTRDATLRVTPVSNTAVTQAKAMQNASSMGMAKGQGVPMMGVMPPRPTLPIQGGFAQARPMLPQQAMSRMPAQAMARPTAHAMPSIQGGFAQAQPPMLPTAATSQMPSQALARPAAPAMPTLPQQATDRMPAQALARVPMMAQGGSYDPYGGVQNQTYNFDEQMSAYTPPTTTTATPSTGGTIGIGDTLMPSTQTQTKPTSYSNVAGAVWNPMTGQFDAPGGATSSPVPTPIGPGITTQPAGTHLGSVPVTQDTLAGFAQQYAPPAVRDVLAGTMPSPMRFSFPLPTPGLLASMSPDELRAYNTALAYQGPGGTTLEDVEHQVRKQFGPTRARPRGRFLVA